MRVFILMLTCDPPPSSASQGAACNDKVSSVLKDLGVPQMTSAAALKGYTLGDAIAQGKLQGGGHLLAITDPNALNQHYDPSQTCTGTKGVSEYTCYTDSSSKAYPLNRMFGYLNATAAALPPADGTLYAMQALWEESAETVRVKRAACDVQRGTSSCSLYSIFSAFVSTC